MVSVVITNYFGCDYCYQQYYHCYYYCYYTFRYGLRWQQSLKACMKRELKLVYRDRFNLYSRTFQITYLAFLAATLFIKPGNDTVAEGQLVLLEIFFAALISTFAGFGKVGQPSQVLA